FFAIPPAMTNYPAIRLREREGRRVLMGAPWAFSNEIVLDGAAKALTPGSLVRLVRANGDIVGTGYFNPHSLIAVRLLSRLAEVEIGEAFFAERLALALALRTRLYEAPYYRLVHAEGDGLPGLTIDRFGGTCAVQVTTAGMEALTDAMLAALDAVVAPTTV